MRREDWLKINSALLSNWLWDPSNPNFVTGTQQYLGREKYRTNSAEKSSLCTLRRKFNTLDVSISWNINRIYAIYQGEFLGYSMVSSCKIDTFMPMDAIAVLFSKQGNGANLDLHQGMTGQRKCSDYTQCNLCNYIIVTKRENEIVIFQEKYNQKIIYQIKKLKLTYNFCFIFLHVQILDVNF